MEINFEENQPMSDESSDLYKPMVNSVLFDIYFKDGKLKDSDQWRPSDRNEEDNVYRPCSIKNIYRPATLPIDYTVNGEFEPQTSRIINETKRKHPHYAAVKIPLIPKDVNFWMTVNDYWPIVEDPDNDAVASNKTNHTYISKSMKQNRKRSRQISALKQRQRNTVKGVVYESLSNKDKAKIRKSEIAKGVVYESLSNKDKAEIKRRRKIEIANVYESLSNKEEIKRRRKIAIAKKKKTRLQNL